MVLPLLLILMPLQPLLSLKPLMLMLRILPLTTLLTEFPVAALSGALSAPHQPNRADRGDSSRNH